MKPMLNEYSIAIWVAATVMASFAFILSLSNKKPATRAGVIFVLLASAWAIGVGFFYHSTTPEIALPWIIYNHTTGIAIATSFFFLGYLINWNRFPARWISVSVILSLLVVASSYILFDYLLITDIFIPMNVTARTWTYGPLAYLHYGYFIGMFAAGVHALRKHASQVSDIQRSYIHTMHRAALIGIVPVIFIVLILRVFGFTNLLWIVPFFTLGWIVLAGYALVSYRVQSVRLFISEVFVLTMVVLLFANIFITEELFTEVAKILVFIVFTIFGLLFLGQVGKSELQRRELITLNKKLRNSTNRLAEANFKLKELSEQKTQFISFASHQIKNPLSSILGYASLIHEGSLGKVGKKVDDAAGTIMRSTKNLVRTVEDFLDVSKAELEQMQLNKEDVDVVELIEGIVRLLSVNTKEKGINIIYDEPIDAILLLADRDKLRNAIFNVIENAVKYTQEGWVTVTSAISDTAATIEIKDTGVGMNEDELTHAFDRFYRSQNAKSTNGSGLGLFLARDIVRRHGGDIIAHSDGQGSGSTFIITLPLNHYSESA